jgi:phytol kinase
LPSETRNEKCSASIVEESAFERMFANNGLALIASFSLALIWLRLNDYAAHRNWIESSLSRKVIHIGTGPIFVLSWLFFQEDPLSRWLAALIPLAITLQFILVGVGAIRDPAAVKAMSRTGDRKEILRGPLYYGIAFVVLTVLYWKESPIGIIALMMLCGGDGLADVIGKRFRSRRLPWSPRKTAAGTLSVFVGGWIFSMLILSIYVFFGILANPVSSYLLPVTLIALAAMVVESLPLDDLDNLTVPLVSVLLGHLLFH